MPQAPIVVRYRHTTIHCNDPAMVPAILQQLAPQDTNTDAGVLATVAKNVLQVVAQHFAGHRIRSLPDVIYLAKSHPKQLHKQLELVNAAYSLQRRVPLVDLQNLPRGLEVALNGCAPEEDEDAAASSGTTAPQCLLKLSNSLPRQRPRAREQAKSWSPGEGPTYWQTTAHCDDTGLRPRRLRSPPSSP